MTSMIFYDFIKPSIISDENYSRFFFFSKDAPTGFFYFLNFGPSFCDRDLSIGNQAEIA